MFLGPPNMLYDDVCYLTWAFPPNFVAIFRLIDVKPKPRSPVLAVEGHMRFWVFASLDEKAACGMAQKRLVFPLNLSTLRLQSQRPCFHVMSSLSGKLGIKDCRMSWQFRHSMRSSSVGLVKLPTGRA